MVDSEDELLSVIQSVKSSTFWIARLPVNLNLGTQRYISCSGKLGIQFSPDV